MNIIIKTKNLELTPALKDWVDDKIGGLSKFVKRFEEKGEILCEVEIARTSNHHHKGDVHYAEVNLRLPNKLFRASVDDADARVAIDRARDMLHRDLMKYKDTEGFSGKAMRHMARLGRGAANTAGKLIWWRQK